MAVERPVGLMGNDCYADLHERMYRDFEHRHRLSVITTVIRQCRADLDTLTPHALPELVDRLARQRLTDLDPTLDTAPSRRGAAGVPATPDRALPNLARTAP
jgi:hypothetical protein